MECNDSHGFLHVILRRPPCRALQPLQTCWRERQRPPPRKPRAAGFHWFSMVFSGFGGVCCCDFETVLSFSWSFLEVAYPGRRANFGGTWDVPPQRWYIDACRRLLLKGTVASMAVGSRDNLYWTFRNVQNDEVWPGQSSTPMKNALNGWPATIPRMLQAHHGDHQFGGVILWNPRASTDCLFPHHIDSIRIRCISGWWFEPLWKILVN